MIKRVAVLLILCFLFMTPLVAYADVIVEPENDFFNEHQRQIVYLGRSFTANGESGNVPVKKEPGSKDELAEIKNGETIYVEYSFLYEGDYWGITSYEGGESGWVKMDQLLVLYDYVAFEEDHFDELYLYGGDYAEIKEAGAAIAWPWPGADAPIWTVEDLDMESFRVTYAYRDDEGREWGFVTYLYGSRNIWICLSEPLNSDIPVFNPTPEPRVWVSDTVHIDIKQREPEKESPTIVIIAVLVTVLVIGTAVLIRVFWKPKKAGRESRD